MATNMTTNPFAAIFFMLDGKKVIQVTEEEWFGFFLPKHVGDTEIGPIRISTVFLGLNHRWGRKGPPLVFETIVFRGSHPREQERYSTWEEAEAGHHEHVQRIRAEILANAKV